MRKYLQSSGFVSELDTSTVTIHQFRRKFSDNFIGYFIKKEWVVSHHINHITGTRVSVSDKMGLMSFRVPPLTHCYLYHNFNISDGSANAMPMHSGFQKTASSA